MQSYIAYKAMIMWNHRLYSRIPCAGQENMNHRIRIHIYVMNHIIPCAGELLVGSCVLIRLL